MRFFLETPGRVKLNVQEGEVAKANQSLAIAKQPAQEFLWDINDELMELSYKTVIKVFQKLVGKSFQKGDRLWSKKNLFNKTVLDLVMPLDGVIKKVVPEGVVIQPLTEEEKEFSLPFSVKVETIDKNGIWCQVKASEEVMVEWLTPHPRTIINLSSYFESLADLDRLKVEDRIMVVDDFNPQLYYRLLAFSAKGILVNSSRFSLDRFDLQKEGWLFKTKGAKIKKYYQDQWLVINENKLAIISNED